ncbi:MAG: reverse transcriptase/maturase family protein [bacterium]
MGRELGDSRGGSYGHSYPQIKFGDIVSLENLVKAWYEFRNGKRSKRDVQEFEFTLEDSIFELAEELKNGSYKPQRYHQFRINDPKPRLISKAAVRDRLVHHAIYRILYPHFDTSFIFDSYSCRVNKGTHKAFDRLQDMIGVVSRNYTKPCFALKMDIRRFFDSIDHGILLELLKYRIEDEKVINLLHEIIESFEVKPGKGMPIGNLTSQLFANVYMDPLDKFVKHKLKARYYLRYADDFLILASSESELMGCFVEINVFLKETLKLELHPNKISLRKLSWGIDFVGYVARPHYSVPRNGTAKRMLRNIGKVADPEKVPATLDSYLGYLSHVSARKIEDELRQKAADILGH